MQFSDIKGLGPAKQQALRDAGINNIEDLAGLDLRRNVEVQGVTKDGLKDLKQRARRVLASEGKPVPKAPYTKNGKATTNKASTASTAKPAQEPVASFGKKPGFLKRILTRRS